MLKKFLQATGPGSGHWVGDGFLVLNFFPSNNLDALMSPFALLDYAKPAVFPPSEHQRGVGKHPHRGIETVTLAYQGSVQHRDSAGHQGVIHAGDVQWMTAGAGVVHEEMHAEEFTRQGGTLEMIQLWVNVPRAHKMTAPRYQTLPSQQIPVLQLVGGGYLRIIAGEYQGRKGPASTFSPLALYDVFIKAGEQLTLQLQEGHNTGIFIRKGEALINQLHFITGPQLVAMTSSGNELEISATNDVQFLIMSGEPINEPIARRGPFVMNSEEEIEQAYADFRAGKMG